jgi:hypothetical protein
MDEVHRIILETVNKEKVDLLNEALKLEQQAIRDANEQLQQGAIGQQAYEAAAVSAATKIAAANTQIAALNKETRDFSRAGLQASYVLDDLVNTSGNWTRHLAAISNNIPGLVSSLGMGAGVAGVVGLVSTALIALAPVADSAWRALVGGESAEKLKERLKEAREEIARTHEAFQKLVDTPTDDEKKSAKATREYLGERPHADQARAAVALGMSADEASAELTPEERAGIVTDEEIEAQLGTKKYRFADKEKRRAALKKLRSDYLAKVFAAARQRKATHVVNVAAGNAGPEGDLAREELRRLTKGVPGLEDLQQTSPEAMKRDEEDADALDAKNVEISDSGKAIGDARKKAAKAAKDHAARHKREEQWLQRRTADDMRSWEQKERQDKEAQDNADKADQAAEKAAEKAGLKADKLKPMSDAALERATREQFQRDAMKLMGKNAQQGGLNQRDQAWLRGLQQKLGNDMPRDADIQSIMQATQAGAIANQGGFRERLGAAHRAEAEVRRVAAAQREFTQIQETQQATQAAMNGTQGNFHQRLAEARRVLADQRAITTQTQQAATNNGVW